MSTLSFTTNVTAPPSSPTDDEPLFADESVETATPPGVKVDARWKVLVVDDEPEVHKVTVVALRGLEVDGFPLELVHAHDGQEARQHLREHQDVALVLLDVVMATEDDGLQVARWIRKELHNPLVRIVLRTGQPGHAPERQVMLGYDINDYQPKAELSVQRLVTAVVGAIRGYRDLRTIAAQKQGLEKIIGATASLFERSSVEAFTSGVLQQLTGLASPHESAMFFQGPREVFEPEEPCDLILAATGRFAQDVGKRATEVVPPGRQEALLRALRTAKAVEGEGYAVFSLSSAVGGRTVQAGIYIEGWAELDDWRRRLLELFCANATVAFENQRLMYQQQRVLAAVSRFVPEGILETVGKTELTQLALGDQVQREMTVLFLDIRQFTPLAERLGPRDTFRLLNRLFGELVPRVHAHGGTIDKYLGDGFLAVFAGPPETAVRAAYDMLQGLDAVRGVPEELGGLGEQLDVGIGIHHGMTIVGLVGTMDRLEATVVADAVNVAARLEQLTRRYGSRILVSEAVFSRLPEDLRSEARSLGPQLVRGKKQPVICHDLGLGDAAELRAHKASTRREYLAAMRACAEGRWGTAAELLEDIARRCDKDWASRTLAEECRQKARGWYDD